MQVDVERSDNGTVAYLNTSNQATCEMQNSKATSACRKQTGYLGTSTFNSKNTPTDVNLE